MAAAIDRHRLLLGVVLIGGVVLSGCLPVPIVHGLGVVPDKEAIESLHPGSATRADVLLLLGEPRYRLDDDRFLMFEWQVAYGWIVPAGGQLFPLTAPNYLCLEFDQDSNLVRREQFAGALYSKNADKAIRRCIKGPEESDESLEK